MVELKVPIKEFWRMFSYNNLAQSYHLQCGIVVPIENVIIPFKSDEGMGAPPMSYIVRFKTEQEVTLFVLSTKGSIVLE